MSARSAEWRQACGRVHACAKQLGLDDDARRDLQRRAVGKESCADMTAAELRRVLSEMDRADRPGRRDRAARAARSQASGASARRVRESDKRAGDLPDSPLAGKLVALWVSGWHLGVVRDRTDAALAKWVCRQTGLDAAAWARPADLTRAVEALQAWLAREGGVDWSPYVTLDRNGKPRETHCPRARVLEAQWRILHRAGVVDVGSNSALGAYASRHAGLGHADSHLALDGKQADALIRNLGARIRRAQIEAAT